MTYTAVVLNYGTAVLNDGVFKQTAKTPKWRYPQVLMNSIDDNDPATPSMSVKGGSYSNVYSNVGAKIAHPFGDATSDTFSISGGTFSAYSFGATKIDSYLASGASTVKSKGVFTVYPDDAATAAAVKSGDIVYPKSTAPVASAARIAGALPSNLVLKGDKSITSYTVSDAAKTKEQAVKVVATQDGAIYFTTEAAASSFVAAAQNKGESVATAPAHVTIKFMDGDNEVENRELNYGDAFGSLPAMADRDDADFEAWVDDSDGDELAVSANKIARSDMTIKAKWAHVNKVTFVSRGTTVETRRIHDGEAVGELPVIEEVAGYTAQGWFDAEGADASEVDADLVPTQDMTLYAKWTKNPAKPAEDNPGTGSTTGDSKHDGKTDSAAKKDAKKARGDLPRTGDIALLLPLAIGAAGVVAIVASRFIDKHTGSVR